MNKIEQLIMTSSPEELEDLVANKVITEKDIVALMKKYWALYMSEMGALDAVRQDLTDEEVAKRSDAFESWKGKYFNAIYDFYFEDRIWRTFVQFPGEILPSGEQLFDEFPSEKCIKLLRYQGFTLIHETGERKDNSSDYWVLNPAGRKYHYFLEPKRHQPNATILEIEPESLLAY